MMGTAMIRVLVVDDDVTAASVHVGFVRRVPGFAVVAVAHTGQQALEAAAECEPDLVLLDLNLPDLGGFEVVERLHADQPNLDVMAVTAVREIHRVRQALQSGVVQYLIKPFSGEELRSRLEHYAGTYRRLADAPTVGQSDVDRIFGTGGVPRKPPIPKGLSPETTVLVERALRSASQPMSAAECGLLVGISRVSARRYLEHFVAAGRARVDLSYGAGRPERRYRLAGREVTGGRNA